ncbi:MAG: deoxyhypusine synthase [Nanoarchaeota archaeon]|nr:deoxyhypusine synthase [Nanoarchaeota archaeon]
MKKISSGDVSKSRKNVLGESDELSGISIKGYNFNKGIDYEKLIDSFSTTGMQADNFYKSIEIINNMIKNKAFIYFGYTSNMVTSGLRDIFRYLAEHKMVNVIVTTVGGVEEDIIKCFGDFILGDFKASGKALRKKKINRAGNIFIPNSRYCDFEDFVIPILEDLYSEQKKTGIPSTPSEIIWKLGEKINNKDSIYYWCWKNEIPVFCPAITDGSLGDMIYFFKSSHPDFRVDVIEDIWKINNTNLGEEKTGVIVLGTGVIKHHICNANLFRNGADYAVYINNAPESDGSDSGALPEEAVSWGKLALNSERIKVFGDAILLFPFIVAKTFAKQNSKFPI